MIKAYFFDWMWTLAYYIGKDDKEMLSEEEQRELAIKRFGEVNIPNKRKRIISSYLKNVELILYPDSEEVIDNLKKQGYPLAIVSDIYDITAEKVKKLFPNFINAFDFITWSCERGIVKPSPDMFIHTLDQLNNLYNLQIIPEEVMMIGDSQRRDIEPALALGMQARLIDREKQNLKDFLK